MSSFYYDFVLKSDADSRGSTPATKAGVATAGRRLINSAEFLRLDDSTRSHVEKTTRDGEGWLLLRKLKVEAAQTAAFGSSVAK